MSLTFRGITKRFGPTTALNNVSLSISAGHVHALLGENGAGKSTLLHIAYGMAQADAGTVEVGGDGNAASARQGFSSPRAARAAGIGLVHQHFSSISALTVAENIALTAGWSESGRAAERRAQHVADRLGLPLPVADHVEGLSVQLRQRLEIVKALATDARILLLDEPTAVLAPREVTEFLAFIRSFAASGGAVALITHKLDEVFRAADHVTVLRRGDVALQDALSSQSPQSLSRAMIGADVPRAERRGATPGEVLIRANQLVVTDGARRRSANSFDIRAGEVVGVAAIEGNGQRALLRAIAGVDAVAIVAGVLEVAGPVAFIPEDRTTEGLIGDFTLAENLLLGTLPNARPWLDWRGIRARTDELLRTHDVRAPDADVPARTLSGGNQQKFVFARALAGGPRVIVAENPTRGLDLLATHAIHEGLRQAAQGGAAVVVHSSDLDEVLALADRLFVIARGEVRELPIATPRELVGDAMLALEVAS